MTTVVSISFFKRNCDVPFLVVEKKKREPNDRLLSSSAASTIALPSSSSSKVVCEDGLIDTWVQVGLDIDGEALGDNFGRSVALSADGSVVAIGGHFNDGNNGSDSGHVRVYRLNSSDTWVQVGLDIDGASYDESGTSISLSADVPNVV